MSLFNWLFGDHRCDHSICVDKKEYEKVLEQHE